MSKNVFLKLAVLAFIALGVGYYIYDHTTRVQQIQARPELLLQRMPQFSYALLDGGEINRQELLSGREPLIYVHLWATWCAPCIHELPELLTFASKLSGKAIFLLVAVNDELDDVRRFVDENLEIGSNNIIFALDPHSESFPVFGTRRLPETFVFAAGSGLSLIRYAGAQEWLRTQFSSDARRFLESMPQR